MSLFLIAVLCMANSAIWTSSCIIWLKSISALFHHRVEYNQGNRDCVSTANVSHNWLPPWDHSKYKRQKDVFKTPEPLSHPFSLHQCLPCSTNILKNTTCEIHTALAGLGKIKWHLEGSESNCHLRVRDQNSRNHYHSFQKARHSRY